MNERLKWVVSLFALTALTITSAANATLIPRLDGKAYFDDESGLTWLGDVNYAQTTGVTADGEMSWFDANDWAATVEIEGVSGWRLPATLQPDPTCSRTDGISYYDYNCRGSEMGNMFYNVLGGRFGTPISAVHNDNYDLFINLENDNYWSSNIFEPQPVSGWYFYSQTGQQNAYDRSAGSMNSWLVYDGDVQLAVSSNDPDPVTGTIPEPSAIALLMLGLAAIGIYRRSHESRDFG